MILSDPIFDFSADKSYHQLFFSKRKPLATFLHEFHFSKLITAVAKQKIIIIIGNFKHKYYRFVVVNTWTINNNQPEALLPFPHSRKWQGFWTLRKCDTYQCLDSNEQRSTFEWRNEVFLISSPNASEIHLIIFKENFNENQ